MVTEVVVSRAGSTDSHIVEGEQERGHIGLYCLVAFILIHQVGISAAGVSVVSHQWPPVAIVQCRRITKNKQKAQKCPWKVYN